MVKKALNKLKEQPLSEEEFFLGSEFPVSDWFAAQEQTEGQLSVDVYQTGNDIVIKAPVAGVPEDSIDITVLPDQVTIRGERSEEREVADEHYHAKECFWGSFSRTVSLPAEGDVDSAKATFKNGILTIRVPKSKRNQAVKLKVNTN